MKKILFNKRRMVKNCNDDQILNPKSDRCVKRSGKIGQELLKQSRSPKSVSPTKNKTCKDTEILNPKSGRCVKRSGKIGQELLKNNPENVFSPLLKKKRTRKLYKTPVRSLKNPIMVSPKSSRIKGRVRKMTSRGKNYITQSVRKFHMKNAIPQYKYERKNIYEVDKKVVDYLSKRYGNIDNKRRRFLFEKKGKDINFFYAIGDNKLLNVASLVNGKLKFYDKHNEISDYLSEFMSTSRFTHVFIVYQNHGHSVSHQNALIIDNVEKTMERFEPHGYTSTFVDRKIDMMIIQFLMNKFEFTYYDFLPFTQTNLKKNLQYLQTDDDKKKGLKNEEGEIGGYCYPWCVFYLHMAIK